VARARAKEGEGKTTTSESTVKDKVTKFQETFRAMQVDQDTRHKEGKRIIAPACPNSRSTSSRRVHTELSLTYGVKPGTITALCGRKARHLLGGLDQFFRYITPA